MQRHDVRAGEQRVERINIDAADAGRGRGELWRAHDVVPEHPTPEATCAEDLRRGKPDPARADDAHRLPGQRVSEQALQREVALAHAQVRLVRAPVERLDECDGKLCHGRGRVGGYSCHEQVQPSSCVHVDVVVACAAEQDCADAVGGEGVENGCGEGIVDEDADGVYAGRGGDEAGGGGGEGGGVEG